jgi:hypothetical protein
MRFMVTLSQWVDKKRADCHTRTANQDTKLQAFGAAKEKAVNDVAPFRTDATHSDQNLNCMLTTQECPFTYG